MELIFISILLLSAFSFVGVLTLSYAIYDWENQKLDDMTKDLVAKKVKTSNLASGLLSKISNTIKPKKIDPLTEILSINTELNMKIHKKVGDQLNRTLVTVKDQDYRGMFEKTLHVAKKVYKNLDIYTKIGFKKLYELITKDKIKPEIVDSPKSKIAADQTIEKIVEFNNSEPKTPPVETELNQRQSDYRNNSQSNQVKETKDDFQYFDLASQKFSGPVFESNTEQNPKYGNATLDLASTTSSSETNKVKSAQPIDPVYEKIEASILEKLQQTGLNHYDIWLELGKHYEKYNETEKAIEVYSMVMKHSEGKNKEIARNGLIALS